MLMCFQGRLLKAYPLKTHLPSLPAFLTVNTDLKLSILDEERQEVSVLCAYHVPFGTKQFYFHSYTYSLQLCIELRIYSYTCLTAYGQQSHISYTSYGPLDRMLLSSYHSARYGNTYCDLLLR
jgi:hypothetical protein